MANHQSGRKKLNMREDLRRSVLRNQAATFIKYGCLQSTRARVKEVQKMVEKLVTIARENQDFNTIRRVRKELPYDLAVVKKLVYELAPKYVSRPGGYTRVLLMGTRTSDTAKIARLEWVSATTQTAEVVQ
jgi:large subunit ribosomal protein L17